MNIGSIVGRKFSFKTGNWLSIKHLVLVVLFWLLLGFFPGVGVGS